MVRKTGVILKKIWEDEQFFEINFEVRSPFCDSNMNFYTTNAELGELRQGLLLLSSFKQDEYVWQSGEDTENISHYVYTKWFLQDKLGHIGVEILLDNKLQLPDKMRSQSCILTEINQLDDFTNQLESLIEGKTEMIEGLLS